jgi:carboxypeptidase C (cathepsin A)
VKPLLYVIGLGFVLFSPIQLCAQSPSPSPSATKETKKEPPEPVVSDHEITIGGGKKIAYQAVTGYLLVRDETATKPAPAPPEASKNVPESKERPTEKTELSKGEPKEQIFFTAYQAKGVTDPSTRPVTFAFNGGPGSASIWLHLGALGPRRVLLSDRGEALPPPYKLVDNDSTWLEESDLVFIDPVQTGFSRPIVGEEAKQFHSYKKDIADVAEFIRLWLTRYKRWSSPKFLAGESYGTIRAAGLTNYLLDTSGISLNGVVLISSCLNTRTLSWFPGVEGNIPNNDAPYPLLLPTFAAAAWYHGRLAPELENRPLLDFLSEVEAFARAQYTQALAKGDRLTEAEKKDLAAQIARYSGLTPEYVETQNFRETFPRFRKELLKDKRLMLGAYDARFTGAQLALGGESSDFDPSEAAVLGPFSSAFNDYIRRELNFESDLPYHPFANVFPWSFDSDVRPLDVIPALKTAMNRNPYMKVMICSGLYDLVTPYLGPEELVHEMDLLPSLAKNVRLNRYGGGHMMYIDKGAREQLKRDFAAFVRDSTNNNLTESAKPVGS